MKKKKKKMGGEFMRMSLFIYILRACPKSYHRQQKKKKKFKVKLWRQGQGNEYKCKEIYI